MPKIENMLVFIINYSCDFLEGNGLGFLGFRFPAIRATR
jgi:hypothetical protein